MRKKIFKKLVVIMIMCIMMLIGIQDFNSKIYAENIVNKTEEDNSSSLTKEQIIRIKKMAEDKSYIRDIDDFNSVEAYQKYLEYKEKKGDSQKVNNLFSSGGIISPMATSSATAKNASLAITLKGLSPAGKYAIQKFYIGTSYVYTVQRSGSTVYLSRLTLSDDKKTATYKDQMILTNFGHCQTLEYFEWKEQAYFLMTCKDDEGKQKDENGTPYYWSLQVARVPYTAGGPYNYTKYKRLCYINKANKSGTATADTKRCDAALSSDKKTLLLWCRDTNNKMQFSRYNMNKINQALDNSSSLYISCASASVKAAWLATNTPKSSEVFAATETSSMQGLELNDANCTYIANGPSNQNKFIIKLGSGGSVLNTIKINNSELLAGTQTEIEGLQLKGDYVYFGLCNHNQKNTGVQYIYSIAKSIF